MKYVLIKKKGIKSSTTLQFEHKEARRNLSKIDRKWVQTLPNFDRIIYQFMPNNFFAFSVVALPTSANEMPFSSAICSATSFTYAGSFLFPL